VTTIGLRRAVGGSFTLLRFSQPDTIAFFAEITRESASQP